MGTFCKIRCALDFDSGFVHSKLRNARVEDAYNCESVNNCMKSYTTRIAELFGGTLLWHFVYVVQHIPSWTRGWLRVKPAIAGSRNPTMPSTTRQFPTKLRSKLCSLSAQQIVYPTAVIFPSRLNGEAGPLHHVLPVAPKAEARYDACQNGV